MRIGIIGGGAAGLAAAYELITRGHFAEVFEAAPFLGGQASTFPVGGGNLERGYHHLFVSDTDMVQLIEELGLGDSLQWLESRVGLFHGGPYLGFCHSHGPAAVCSPDPDPAHQAGSVDFHPPENPQLAQVRRHHRSGLGARPHGRGGLASHLGTHAAGASSAITTTRSA